MLKPEEREQMILARWIEDNYPTTEWTASAGGMRVRIGTAKKMKAMGYKKGTPDLMIYEPRGEWHGLIIEFKKTGGGVRSADQKEKIAKLRARGYCATFTDGLEEAKRIIKSYLAYNLISEKL